MRLVEARISYLIYGGVLILIAIIFWLAQGRQVLLESVEGNFTRLQQVARTGRLAAEVGNRLAGLTAVIREYVASDAIDPPARIEAESRHLLGSITRARLDLPAERGEIDRLEREADQYLASFEAVVVARRQRQERMHRLALAAAEMRVVSAAAGQQARLNALREAELGYLTSHNAAEADRVFAGLAALAQAIPGRRAADACADYELAFARVAEIIGVLDRATVKVLEVHDARLRGLAGSLVLRAQAGEGAAIGSFRETLAQASRRNVEVTLAAVVIAVIGGFLLVRFVIYPLNRMTTTMTAIAGGDYSQAVPYAVRRDEIGQMARALSTFRNALLELKAAQAQAEDASRHKSDFIANMSHELRTPLNAIIGLSDMLMEDADNPEPRELKESLPRIASAAKHLLALINEILDLSRIEAGHMAVELTCFAPGLIAEESLATVAPIARQKGLAVSASYPAGLPDIESDPQRVRQILINLIGNAVKFTDTGMVRVEVSGTPAGVRFSVIDTGPGIAREDIGRLFQEFTQLDASPTRKFGGSGLGLALSRRMARLIGGDVTLVSEVGQGSTFVLDLPLKAPQVRGGELESARSGKQSLDVGGGAA